MIPLFCFGFLKPAMAQHFELDGYIKGANGIMVYLLYPSGKGNADLDRTDSILAVNGKFVFSGEVTEPVAGYVYTTKPDFTLPLFISPGTIKVTGSLKDREGVKAWGPLYTNEYQHFRNEEEPIKKRRDLYMGLMTSRELADDSEARMWLVDSFYSTYTSLRSLVIDFVQAHPHSQVSAYLLYEKFSNEDNIDKALALLKTLDTHIQQSYYAVALKDLALKAGLSKAGKGAPLFSETDSNGLLVKLEDFRGQIVLLDFWASWCAPCRHENPNVVAMYKKYHERGFTVLGVSLDNNRTAWLKAVYADGLNWTQLSDLNGSNSATAELYNVTALPANWLIDKEGNILGKNLFGKDLEEKLQEVLGP